MHISFKNPSGRPEVTFDQQQTTCNCVGECTGHGVSYDEIDLDKKTALIQLVKTHGDLRGALLDLADPSNPEAIMEKIRALRDVWIDLCDFLEGLMSQAYAKRHGAPSAQYLTANVAEQVGIAPQDIPGFTAAVEAAAQAVPPPQD